MWELKLHGWNIHFYFVKRKEFMTRQLFNIPMRLNYLEQRKYCTLLFVFLCFIFFFTGLRLMPLMEL